MVCSVADWSSVRRSSFSDFASKYSKDERYRGIDKVRDKEDIFKDYVSELRRKEKEESRHQKEKVTSSRFLVTQRHDAAETSRCLTGDVCAGFGLHLATRFALGCI